MDYLVRIKLTSEYTKPLKLNQNEIDKSNPWDNLLFILFYGYFNRIAMKMKNNESPDVKYYMRNSNIPVGIPINVMTTYFNKQPEVIVYNMCIMAEDTFRFNPLGKTEFPVVNEIPINIMNRYTEIPLYDVALAMISKKNN